MDATADTETFKRLIPLDSLSGTQLNTVLNKLRVEQVEAGTVLFAEGERDGRHVYVLAGEVELENRAGDRWAVVGGTAQARQPLAPSGARMATARTRGAATIAAIDSHYLDVVLTWDQSRGLVVEELDVDDGEPQGDWMTGLLQTHLFDWIPPANIQALFMALESVSYAQGETVIRQGEAGEHFYIVKHGRCEVTRQLPGTAQPTKVDEIGVGDVFGEEALISGAQRNATITMLTDGTMARLSRRDFDRLVKEPVVQRLSYGEALERPNALWLDVRLPDEHNAHALAGSVNVPLALVRRLADNLQREREYIVYCDTGRRSMAAAFVLSELGFDVRVLDGGLAAVP